MKTDYPMVELNALCESLHEIVKTGAVFRFINFNDSKFRKFIRWNIQRPLYLWYLDARYEFPFLIHP